MSYGLRMLSRSMSSDEREATKATTMAEWVTKLSILGATHRDAYRMLRELMWRDVVENSARSDFPSDYS